MARQNSKPLLANILINMCQIKRLWYKLCLVPCVCLAITQCSEKSDELKKSSDSKSSCQLVVYRLADAELQLDLFAHLKGVEVEQLSLSRLKTTEAQNKKLVDIAYSCSKKFPDSVRESIQLIYHLDAASSPKLKLQDDEVLFSNRQNLYCYLTPENQKFIDQKIQEHIRNYTAKLDEEELTAELSVLKAAKGIKPEKFNANNTKEHLRVYQKLKPTDKDPLRFQNLNMQHNLPDKETVYIQHILNESQKEKAEFKLIHQDGSSDFYSKVYLHSSAKNYLSIPKPYKHQIPYLTSPDYTLLSDIQSDLFLRKINVPEDIFYRSSRPASSIDPIEKKLIHSQDSVEKIFTSMGVKITEGGYIRFDPDRAKLVVRLGINELEKVEEIVAGQPVDTSVQIQADIELLKIPLPDSGTHPEKFNYSDALTEEKFRLFTLPAESAQATANNKEISSIIFICESLFLVPDGKTNAKYLSGFSLYANQLTEGLHLSFPHNIPSTIYQPLFTSIDKNSLLVLKVQYSEKEYDKNPSH